LTSDWSTWTGGRHANQVSGVSNRPSVVARATRTDPALDKTIISSYKEGVRRRKGALLPLEVRILGAVAEARTTGDGWIHGFGLARAMQGDGGRLTAHGTLYKALGRLTDGGLLDDEWEDPDRALAEGRPRRRLYRINGSGLAALARAEAEDRAAAGAARPGIAPA